MACKPRSVARECKSSARALVWRAREPCWVCSRIRIEVSRICLWRERRAVRLLVSSVRAVRSSCGILRVAEVIRSSAAVGREDGDGTSSGEAMVHRWAVSVCSCVETTAAIMSILSRNKVTSPERISRSDGSGIWPESSAETRSMQAWRSSGRVGAREGRVVKVLMST